MSKIEREGLKTIQELRTDLEKAWLKSTTALVNILMPNEKYSLEEAIELSRTEAAAFLDDLSKRM